MNASPYVAVLVFEATDIRNKAHLAIVLKITSLSEDGQEFFVSLSDVRDDRRVHAITVHIKDITNKFHIHVQ